VNRGIKTYSAGVMCKYIYIPSLTDTSKTIISQILFDYFNTILLSYI